jgi:hypothetical protein
MTVHFNGDGGLRGFFGDVLQGLGGRSAPKIGHVIQVMPGESVPAPPRGRLWYSPEWAESLYELHDLVRRPVFEVGDVFGIHPEDPVPLPPSGTQLARLSNPKPAEGVGAVLYKIVLPPALEAVMALPKPKPPTLQAYAIGDRPVPREDQRFQIAYVDGRNLNRVVGALVAA